MTTRYGSATVTLPSDTTILITREFEAPRALVWDALTTPRHLLRWWGPSWCPLVSCEIDLQVGGTWRYVAVGADGVELAWRGTYREIESPHRIVSTEVFEGFPDAESLNTTTLDEAGGVTTLRTLVEHVSREARDGHLASGMEAGMQETFDRLDQLLARSATTAERFRRVAGRFTDRAHEVPSDGWDRPTPCEGWMARDIVRHMADWMPAMLAGGGIAIGELPAVDGDPVATWEALVDRLQALLDDPETAATEIDLGPPGRQTVEFAVGTIMLGDVVVHTWDLARSAGLDDTIDEVIAAEMLAGMEPIDDMLRSSGHYGPRVDAPPDADVAMRLIAFTGRDPAWGPDRSHGER